jgi:hypothetical protein
MFVFLRYLPKFFPKIEMANYGTKNSGYGAGHKGGTITPCGAR